MGIRLLTFTQHSIVMKLYLFSILFATFEFSCGAPQDYLGNIVNAIADTVQGKEYDSPPYTVAATYEDGSNSFEERNYEGGKNWACVNNANSDNVHDAFRIHFWSQCWQQGNCHDNSSQ